MTLPFAQKIWETLSELIILDHGATQNPYIYIPNTA